MVSEGRKKDLSLLFQPSEGFAMQDAVPVSGKIGADIAVMPDLYKQNAGMMVRGTYLRFRAKINEDGSMRALKIRIIKKSE